MSYFSIITPTHDASHLLRAAASLEAQAFKDFEWIILPNNGARLPDLDKLPNCKIVTSSDELSKRIGLFKKECCMAASGNVIVELDHDDELTPNCLEELYKVFSEEQSIDFAYSNHITFDANLNYSVFTGGGWSSRDFDYKGKTIKEQIAFAPSACSFSKIWYAPNHVRSWKKSFYDSIGGHDASLSVLDDQDLLSRTYIDGNVKWVDKCLYVYHVHGANTCYGDGNAFIQEETLNIHDKYIYQMAEKWADLNGLLKIDLCGGLAGERGYTTIDRKNSDIIHDLDKPWPFKDGEVGVIRAHDSIEHLISPIHTMLEASRSLAPLGWFLTQTPSTDGRGAFQDPTHVSFWNKNSFWYYTNEIHAKYIGLPALFHASRIKDYYPSQYCVENKILYTKADLIKLPNKESSIVVPGHQY
jgi:glycosyltransferase involved in cell wall biosynthesis